MKCLRVGAGVVGVAAVLYVGLVRQDKLDRTIMMKGT